MSSAVLPLFDSPASVVDGSALPILVRQASALYSLPAVASEVLELTDRPDVDAAALKRCIECDTALTAKLLRVVNSSLFGLSGKVSDLNQAIALLGVKPLKLLVLGFSLPDELFAEVAGDQLELYWRSTLARAVAAREISEQWFSQAGDDAFLAGLLQDVGVLVLLSCVGEPYAAFHRQAVEDGVNLVEVENEALGFNHVQLSAALLAHWHMPEALVRAIAEPRNPSSLARADWPHAPLSRVLHLADLLAHLVVRRRINVLPELLEAGGAYCELTKPMVNEVVATLQEKVDSLADVLSVSAPAGMNYNDVLAAAHKQMVALLDEGAAAATTPEVLRGVGLDAWAGSAELAGKTAMVQSAVASLRDQAVVLRQSGTGLDVAIHSDPIEGIDRCAEPAIDFDKQLTLTVGECRAMRQPISAAVLAVDGVKPLSVQDLPAIEQILNVVCRRIDVEGCVVHAVESTRRVLLLPGFERHEAVAMIDDVLNQVRTLVARIQANRQLANCVPSAGVASVCTPPKNFPPQALLETARRCQAAAQQSGGVKSLEIC